MAQSTYQKEGLNYMSKLTDEMPPIGSRARMCFSRASMSARSSASAASPAAAPINSFNPLNLCIDPKKICNNGTNPNSPRTYLEAKISNSSIRSLSSSPRNLRTKRIHKRESSGEISEASGGGASRCSSPTRKKDSTICYNGNYEGDQSMFGISPPWSANRINPSETDSESEYEREYNIYPEREHDSIWVPMQRLYLHMMTLLLSPERMQKVTEFTEKVVNSNYYHRFCELLQAAAVIFVFFMRITLIALYEVCKWTYKLCKSISYIRSTCRKLLWWLTLSKCGDMAMFTLMLVLTPLLFILALLGLLLSVYNALKVFITRGTDYIRIKL